ncbi:hypothetical protein HPB50_016014 [Hyalomma asiaticum]|uniref:Uncharacterized protein n=1 Tax=Hyalomma asiaticum TaxID=266040 RepID=A0ACB7T8E1_HYAAI|nr:hypothetical protein HPB50_016014 [Hyalomma asiaticum]
MADAGSTIRVKLDLRFAVPHREAHNLVWIVVDRAETATIKQFAKLIRAKYGVPKKSELYLEDAWLPPDEPLQILRDKDTVRVVTPAEQPSKPDSQPDDDAPPTPVTDELLEEKKKKKKRRRESSESSDAPAFEANVSGTAERDFSTSTVSTPRQETTPCFSAAHVASTPASFHAEASCSTPQNQSLATTPGWPVPTPDPILSTSPIPAKKKRRPRRKKKKPDEESAQVPESLSLSAVSLPSQTASPSLPLPVAVRVPAKLAQADLPAGKHVRFDGETSDEEEEEQEVPAQQDSQPMVVEETPCVLQDNILELDANYCPHVSEYKEGKVLQHNTLSDFVRIELKRAEAKKTYGGKFELEAPKEGMPPMEKVVSLLWTELLEPVVLSS